MKMDRLIGIITLLLRQDKITAPELAQRFEVSRRTISRDIESLCQAGIPIITEQGYGGGISILEGYKIDKALFTEDELQTIIAGLKGIDTISEREYLLKLLDKLSYRKNRVVADDIIIIDLASHYQKSLTQKIGIIKKAALEHRIIGFKYYYGKGESKRRIEPYRLVFKWSAWYVFGYCMDRKQYRLFKLNRLCDLSLSEEMFFPRAIQDIDLEFGNYFNCGKIHLKAVFNKSEKYRLIEEYGIDSFVVLNNGDLMFEWDFAGYENMRGWVFSFGDKVFVLEPKKLIEDRKLHAENIINMNISNN